MFETTARGLSPKGVGEKVPMELVVVEKWVWSGVASVKGRASRLTAREWVEKMWMQRASIERRTLEWQYLVVEEDFA